MSNLCVLPRGRQDTHRRGRRSTNSHPRRLQRPDGKAERSWGNREPEASYAKHIVREIHWASAHRG